MAVTDTTRQMAYAHLFGARQNGFLARIMGIVAEWNDARVTRNALSRLSDHELDDLGLSRGDIETMYRR